MLCGNFSKFESVKLEKIFFILKISILYPENKMIFVAYLSIEQDEVTAVVPRKVFLNRKVQTSLGIRCKCEIQFRVLFESSYLNK